MEPTRDGRPSPTNRQPVATDLTLDVADFDSDPLKQFERWFQAAIDYGQPEPEAMTLATASKNGRPSARMVLLRHYDRRGLVFFTNYESRKGQELAENAQAALVFYWSTMARQVRVTGRVARVSAEESNSYFRSRPTGSRLGAWASRRQSEVIESRDVLEQRLVEMKQRFDDGEIPRPEYWGGFRVEPDTWEFWQGRPSRLHDRFRYRCEPDGSWRIDRLSP